MDRGILRFSESVVSIVNKQYTTHLYELRIHVICAKSTSIDTANLMFSQKYILYFLLESYHLWSGVLQYCTLLNWQHFRLYSGFAPVPVNWNFVFISQCFAIFKNVIHSVEPNETSSNSASHQAPNYWKCS